MRADTHIRDAERRTPHMVFGPPATGTAGMGADRLRELVERVRGQIKDIDEAVANGRVK